MGFAAAGVDFAKNRAVTMETIKYLKTLKGVRVAPGGFGFRTPSSTYISNKKTIYRNRRCSFAAAGLIGDKSEVGRP